jgi:DMSO/TMAO reductase YedYZ molybdopterin-dependent catalytic subunit
MISKVFFVYTFFGIINLRPKSLQESLEAHWRIEVYGGVRSPTDLTPAIGRGE